MKKKNMKILLKMLVFLIIGYYSTEAVSGNAVVALAGNECNAMFGDPNVTGSLAYYLQVIFNVIKYLGIVLCVFLTIVDFMKALLGDDKEMYKPLAKTAFNRLCYAVILFLLPSLIKTVLSLIGVYGTCGIS